MKLLYEVTTSDGVFRKFATFEEAERWARRYVAASASDEFARSADINGWGAGSASVHLDGNNRVWTDMA